MPETIRLVHAEPLPHPVWLEMISAETLFASTPVGIGVREEEVERLFAGVSAYQVGSLRDELPRHLWADAALLVRAPDLLAVSTHGAGYDTVDVAAMTAAGVLVLNQQGGNAEAVAEHTIGMMLVLLKRIPEAHRAMREGAILINTARQFIHDEAAVLAALESGRLAAAGLDCWDREPQPDPENPLLSHPRVLASPHTAGVTHESRRRIATWAAEQLIGLFLRGERPPRLVNPEAWPRFAERFAGAFGRAPGTAAPAA